LTQKTSRDASMPQIEVLLAQQHPEPADVVPGQSRKGGLTSYVLRFLLSGSQISRADLP